MIDRELDVTRSRESTIGSPQWSWLRSVGQESVGGLQSAVEQQIKDGKLTEATQQTPCLRRGIRSPKDAV